MGNLLRTLEAVDPPLFKKEQKTDFYCDRRHKMMHLKPVARMPVGHMQRPVKAESLVSFRSMLPVGPGGRTGNT